jgi:hypothetical protein
MTDNITTIVTSQAPDAKPIAKSIVLSTNWQTLIDVPQYEVPELIFGGSTTIESGVGEVISPLICSNFSANTASIDLRVYRFKENRAFFFVRNLLIGSNDTIPIPLNGQFFKTGDVLEIKSDTNFAVNVNFSFTLGQSEEDDV